MDTEASVRLLLSSGRPCLHTAACRCSVLPSIRKCLSRDVSICVHQSKSNVSCYALRVLTSQLRSLSSVVGIANWLRAGWSKVRILADPSGRAIQDEGLRPIACWGCGFNPAGRLGCVCCVVSKTQKDTMQDNQDKDTSTNEVLRTREYIPTGSMDVCVVSKDKRQDNQDKDTSTDEVQRE